jgi:membrane-bound lytic murein transglycosylase F
VSGEIDYTIADEEVALVNAAYYSIIDIKTPVSFPQRIAWAVRQNSVKLEEEINRWLRDLQLEPTFNLIYNKYFKNPRVALARAKSDYSTIRGGKISAYDDLIRQWADTIGWDWKLLASQIYQESKFNPAAVSWAGAKGLMQLVPVTAKEQKVRNVFDPEQSIRGGVRHLMFLDKNWSDYISNKEERIKFVLASYNVGLTHVTDARKLAEKYGKNPDAWDDNVENYLLRKSNPRFYKDPVVEAGYCRGEEPVQYVNEILNRYSIYKQLLAG